MYLTATDTEIRKSATNHKKEKGVKRKNKYLIFYYSSHFFIIIEISVDPLNMHNKYVETASLFLLFEQNS